MSATNGVLASRSLASLGLAALLSACAPNVKVNLVAAATPRPDDCQPQVFEIRDSYPANAELVAQIATSDSGGTAGGYECSQGVMRERVRLEACHVGADAIKITAESQPSLFGSGCYKVKADFYRYAAKAAPEVTPVATKPDKVTRLKELQKLKDEGAITDAEFKKLKQDILKE